MADQNINIKLLIDAAESAKTVSETKKALKDLRSAALQVEEGSQAFTSITTAAGELQDKIGDLAATTKYLGDDLKNLKGFTSIATGIAGAFSVAQGAAALFGGQNKDLEESILKVQSAMGVLQGIQAVGEVLQKESAASLFIQNGLRKTAVLLAGEQAIATAATAVANGTATITQRALNAAMNANPILALVGLLALAATALFAFSNKTKEADESQKALNDTLSKTRANGEIEIRTFNSQIEALKGLKTGSEDRAIAIKKINDQYGTTLKNLTDETAFLKQVNIAQKDYVDGAKNRILMKINEAKIETFLTEAQVQREKSLYAAKKANEILASKASLAKALQGKTDEQILQTQFDNFNTEALEIQRLLNVKIEAQKKADELNKRADNALAINSKLITNETAQQKAAREKDAADALKTEQDKAKALADSKSKSNKDKQKAEADHLKKMADLNAEYEKVLAELVVQTNDNLIEQQQLLLSVSGESEANAIATERLNTEVKITEQNRAQVKYLQDLVDAQVKIKEEAGLKVDKEAIAAQQKATKIYQDYLIGSNAIVAGITKQGEEAIYSIQIDYSERRRKLFEETTKRVLATDEYERFIDFLNKSKLLIKEVEGDAEAVSKRNKKFWGDTQVVPIPQDTIDGLNKYYQQYKDNIEGLFDLNRQSNLDQLGSNKKSIEILSALYGEKYNIIKKSENEINKLLEGTTSFAINPEGGQIGLSELIKLDNAKVNELLKQLNIDLASNYQTVLETEQKYFEKSIFQNYTAQQQKLVDNKTAYEKGDISKREFNKNNIEIDKDFNDSEKTLKENHEENLLAIGVVYGEKTQEDIVEFGKARKTEKQRQADEEIAIEQKKNAYLIAAGQSLYNALRGYQDDILANNLARIEQEQEARLTAIDAELLDFDNRDKEISAAEQAKIDERKVIEDKKALVKAEYDKKVRDEKIRQFNIQKAMDIIQIGINTAVAVSASLAPPLLPMVPFIVAAGAAEAFFVAAQQPNFAEGGLVVGPGGPKDDMVSANLSNGEVVINAKSSKKYAGVLNAINQAGGGKAIPYTDSSVSNAMPVADNTNMDDFKSLILDIMNRPIETYVKESSITNAQKSQSAQNRRTSF